MEEWRAIIGHDGYEVSNLGNVRSPRRVLKPALNRYQCVQLGANTTRCVHRLVAEAFIPNPEGKPTVDHIDRNPANNVVSNLRWATRSEQNVNKRPSRPNTSGETYISKDSRCNSWRVEIGRGKQLVFRHCYPTLAEAVVARDAFLHPAAVFAAVENGHPEVVSH